MTTPKAVTRHTVNALPTKMQKSDKLIVGGFFILVGVIAAIIGAVTLLDIISSGYNQASKYQALTLSSAVSSLSFLVGSMLIIVGAVQNKVVDAHNSLIEHLNK